VYHRRSRKEGEGPPHFTLSGKSERREKITGQRRQMNYNPKAKDALSRFYSNAKSKPPPSQGAHHQCLLKKNPLPITLFQHPTRNPY
jgi:hypothetical protein